MRETRAAHPAPSPPHLEAPHEGEAVRSARDEGRRARAAQARDAVLAANAAAAVVALVATVAVAATPPATAAVGGDGQHREVSLPDELHRKGV